MSPNGEKGKEEFMGPDGGWGTGPTGMSGLLSLRIGGN